MKDTGRAVEALLAYEQADEDGVMVLASRQAIHEVVRMLETAEADNERLAKLADVSIEMTVAADGAEKKAERLAAENAGLREALATFTRPEAYSVSNTAMIEYAHQALAGDGSAVLAVLEAARKWGNDYREPKLTVEQFGTISNRLLEALAKLDSEDNWLERQLDSSNAETEAWSDEKKRIYGIDSEDIQCHADRDGECVWSKCPQLRDGEPVKSGRHCPLDSEDGKEALDDG